MVTAIQLLDVYYKGLLEQSSFAEVRTIGLENEVISRIGDKLY